MLGPFIKPLEIIRRMKQIVAPVEAEPAHVALDGVDIFLLFLGGIGVVEAQMAAPAEFLRHAEIQADRLGVADMQIAVRLRRLSGRCILAWGHTLDNDEIQRLLAGFGVN
jgi:hypothetical protein